MRGFVRLTLLVVLLASVASCQRKEPENAYFPLDAGRSWTYRMIAHAYEYDQKPRTLTIESIGEEDVQGVKVSREKIALDGDEHFLFVGVDDKGVFRHATQSAGEAEPSVDEVRDYFLSYPVAVGKKWKGQGAPTFLDVVDRPVPIESTIESVTDVVEVPAGRFTDCVKVKVVGSVAVEEDPDDVDAPDAGTFTLTEETWYAKDVGIVKSIAEEVFDTEFQEDRIKVTTELMALKR